MPYFSKGRVVLVVSSLILFAFMLVVTMNTVTNISAVETNGVGVYWDSNCTDRVFTIDWGTLTPGSIKRLTVYIRNEVEELIYLRMSTTDWNPSKASQYLNLGWDYSGQRMNLGETLQTTLILSLSRYVEGISSFSFDILVYGDQRLLGDVNGDDLVTVVDLLLLKIAVSLGKTVAEKPFCDLDFNNVIDVMDLLRLQIILAVGYLPSGLSY